MSNASDFVIENGVLTKYIGPGGDVVIPDGVASVGGWAFCDCSNLMSITIPNSVTSIGNWAFCECSSLTNITIPNNVTNIGYRAFYKCRRLTSITIPDSVTSVGAWAFSECSSLTSIAIPDSVTSIGDDAFSRCDAISKITMPASMGNFVSKQLTFSEKLRIDIPDISALPAKFKRCAALCYAEDGGDVSDPRYESHMKYLKANAGRIMGIAVKNLPLLSLLCREGCIKVKDVEAYTDAAQKIGTAEAIAMILDYQNSKLTAKQKERAEKQKKKQENTIFDRAAARMEKEDVAGLNFVVTGDLDTFANYAALKAFIESQGAMLQSAVSAETDYIIMNPTFWDTEKAQKAKAIGIEFITERRFNELSGRVFTVENIEFTVENGVLKKCNGSDGDVIIPDGVTSIGDCAFEGCSNLTSITISNSVKSIGNWAFYKCRRLTSITIPDSVTSVGAWAFSECSSLTSIAIPDSVTSIGDDAFSRCDAISKITMPASMGNFVSKQLTFSEKLRIDIPDISALPAKFKRCAALCYAEDGGDVSDPRYESHMKYLKANAGRIMGIAVKNLPLLSLLCREGCIKVKDVEAYTDAAQKIGTAEAIAMILDYQNSKLTAKQKERAEKQKKKQENTIFDRALGRMGKGDIAGLNFVVTGDLETFDERDELKVFIESRGAKLRSAVSAQTDYLITNNTSCDTIKNQKAKALGIEIITERRFNELSGRAFIVENGVLEKYYGSGGDVVIPDSVISIGNWVFSGCENLTSITIPDSVVSIGNSAFSGCNILTSITIPNSVTDIGKWAFKGCSSLTNITIPASVTSIGDWVFEGCSNLTSITIPDSVTNIGNGAFYRCGNLTSITVPTSVTSIGCDAFKKCSSLTSITVPDSVASIGNGAFRGCSSLTSITIPNSVMSIGSRVFSGCENLTSITISDGVKIIGNEVFSGCPNITLHAPAGSYAETYAKEHNIPFVLE